MKVAAFDVPVLSAEESNAVGSLSPELGRSYDQLRQCPIAELSAMERALEKVLTKVRMAKNFEVKCSLAAGMAAGAAAAEDGLDRDEIVAAAKAAAAAAHGTDLEQKTAAARAIREVVKASGALYREQSEAADTAIKAKTASFTSSRPPTTKLYKIKFNGMRGGFSVQHVQQSECILLGIMATKRLQAIHAHLRPAPAAAAANKLPESMAFKRGPPMKNRFMLAPLTNEQSGYTDGILSDDEYTWLTKRAEGGFGCTMTCASHVQAIGQGFAGQLGCWSDDHLPGLTRLCAGIKKHDSVAVVQLHHAGNRTPAELIGGKQPVCPSPDEERGARGLSLEEVEQLIEDFIVAAERCEKAGFDGVELHGAHGYILCQFLGHENNQRTDRYGGSRENRERMVREIITGIRQRCRPDFNLGIRLSPERFGVKLGEQLQFVQELCNEGQLDYIDLSLWDCFKEPIEEEFKGHDLMYWFNQIDRGDTRIGCAGKIMTAEEAQACLDDGMDFVIIGRGAILHHDFPVLAMADEDWESAPTPTTEQHLLDEFLSPSFVQYMKRSFKGFVLDPENGVTEDSRRKSNFKSKRKAQSA
eukprot:g1230.t1